MKVRIAVTVEVDAAEWAAEYGVDCSEVREDVRRYVVSALAVAPVPMVQVK